MSNSPENELENNFFLANKDGEMRKPLTISDDEYGRREFEREMLDSRFAAYLPTWLSFGAWTIEQACRILSGIPTMPIERKSDLEAIENLERRANYNHLMMVAKTYPDFAEGAAPSIWIEWARKIGYPPPFDASGAPDSDEPTATTPAAINGKQTPIEWQEQARAIADEVDKADSPNAYDSVSHIAERVASAMREKGIKGPRGPLSPATILREALQGGKWKRKR